MAMSKDVLGPAIANKIIASDAPADLKNQITKQWTDIAEVIINHIKGATITVASGIPVSTTGSATAQTGATTSTGTATIS